MPKSKTPTKTQQIAYLIECMMPFCPPDQQAKAGILLSGAPFVKPPKLARGELFSKLFYEAKTACMERHGPRYWLSQVAPGAGRWGTLAKQQASYKSERGTTIRMPRDHFIPAAEFWPGGVIPRGIELTTCDMVPEWREVRPYVAVSNRSIEIPDHVIQAAEDEEEELAQAA